MKKAFVGIIRLMLIVSLLLNLIPLRVFAQINNFDFENYNEYSTEIWDNFMRFNNEGDFKFLTDKSQYGYSRMFESIYSDPVKAVVYETASTVVGEETSTERYLQILTTLMQLFSRNFNEISYKQSQYDTLKDLGDYISEASGFIGNNVENITSVVSKNFFKIQTTDVINSASEIVGVATSSICVDIKNSDDLALFKNLLYDYKRYSKFLLAVENRATDSCLKKAANILRTNLQRTNQIRLTTVSNIAENTAEFLAKDIIFDQLFFDLWREVDTYLGKDIINGLENLTTQISSSISSFQTGVSNAVLLNEAFFNGSSVFNRLNEMKAIEQVRMAITMEGVSIFNSRCSQNFGIEDRANAVFDLIPYMQMLTYIHARGEYCYYNLKNHAGNFPYKQIANFIRALGINVDADVGDLKNWYANRVISLEDLNTKINEILPQIHNRLFGESLLRIDQKYYQYISSKLLDRNEPISLYLTGLNDNFDYWIGKVPYFVFKNNEEFEYQIVFPEKTFIIEGDYTTNASGTIVNITFTNLKDQDAQLNVIDLPAEATLYCNGEDLIFIPSDDDNNYMFTSYGDRFSIKEDKLFENREDIILKESERSTISGILGKREVYNANNDYQYTAYVLYTDNDVAYWGNVLGTYVENPGTYRVEILEQQEILERYLGRHINVTGTPLVVPTSFHGSSLQFKDIISIELT